MVTRWSVLLRRAPLGRGAPSWERRLDALAERIEVRSLGGGFGGEVGADPANGLTLSSFTGVVTMLEGRSA